VTVKPQIGQEFIPLVTIKSVPKLIDAQGTSKIDRFLIARPRSAIIAHMNDLQREALSQQYWRAEDKIRAIHAGKVVHGDPAEIEAKLLEQQDEIEFLLGADYFDKRDRLPD
jgi:hypothetical protein